MVVVAVVVHVVVGVGAVRMGRRGRVLWYGRVVGRGELEGAWRAWRRRVVGVGVVFGMPCLGGVVCMLGFESASVCAM